MSRKEKIAQKKDKHIAGILENPLYPLNCLLCQQVAKSLHKLSSRTLGQLDLIVNLKARKP